MDNAKNNDVFKFYNSEYRNGIFTREKCHSYSHDHDIWSLNRSKQNGCTLSASQHNLVNSPGFKIQTGKFWQTFFR